MRLGRLWESLVSRVVFTLLAGGLALSAGLSVLEWHRSQLLLAVDLQQRTTITVRNLQSGLHGLRADADAQAVRAVLSVFVSRDHHIRAVRLTGGVHQPVTVGDWSDGVGEQVAVWELSDVGISRGGSVALDRLTFVRAPFRQQDQRLSLELLVDGPGAAAAMRQKLYTGLGTMWLLLAMMTLMGLLLLRRWFTGPLGDVVELVAVNAGPEPFHRLGRRQVGEFRQLCGAIAGMLERITDTARQLEQRERAFVSLYEQAPAAMISIDTRGQIIQANRRACELFRAENTGALIGREATAFILPEDRARLTQTIERLTYQDSSSCELRLGIGSERVDCRLEAAVDRDEDGASRSYRLSLTDVSRSKALRRELEQQSWLLNLVIDHMSDAILLVDSSGKVAAHNQQLANLLQLSGESLAGQRFELTEFWDVLGVHNKEQFLARMRRIDADMSRPAQERFETRAGVFLFQGIPVQDAAGKAVGRLWVVQETSPQENSRKLINQQNQQLQLLKNVSEGLEGVGTVAALVERVTQCLYEGMGVGAIGFALRDDAGERRCSQLMHRGSGAYLLETNRAWVDAVASDLMPRVLGSKDVALWTDLGVKTTWAAAARNVGFTCLAAVRLRGTADAQGILWIAQRGGERLERHHIVMIETLAPLLAARLQIAQLTHNAQQAELTDPVTGLPNREHFEQLLSQHSRRPGQACAVVVLHVDQFAQVNEMLDHDGADAVLKTIADAVLGNCRRSTFVCRETGPAFAIVLPGANNQQAAQLAVRSQAAVRNVQPAGLPGEDAAAGLRLTASIGIGSCPADGSSAYDAHDAALVRVDLAKRQGRDRIVAEGPAHSTLAAG